MSFLKKLGQVATNTANAITTKTTELKQVYEKESLSGLLDRAEKNLTDLTDSTNEYLGNLKRVNEKVIHDTAKNANSTFDAILKSTFAVSKETVMFIGKDLKDQALKIYKAWEDIEVANEFSTELNLLYKATAVLSPEDLMAYCGAERDGAIYTMNNIQVEVYGEIWMDVKEQDKQHKGSLGLLQHIVVNSTEEKMTDEFLLRNCLSVMYKIPEVATEYNRLYAQHLLENPDLTPLNTPFDVREPMAQESAEGEATTNSTGELVSKVKESATQYIKSGKEAVVNLANKYKADNTKDEAAVDTAFLEQPQVQSAGEVVEEAVQDFKKLCEEKTATVLQTEDPEVVRLRNELEKAYAKLQQLQAEPQVAPVAEKVKPAAKKAATKKTVKAEAVADEVKPAAKKAARKAATTKAVAEKTVEKPAAKKATTHKKAKPEVDKTEK